MTSKHIQTYLQVRKDYPSLARAADVLAQPPADIIGRDIGELRRGLRNPEKANIVLLAEPGTGKTAYVQGFAYDRMSLRYYLVLDVNPERLIEKDGDRDNALLTGFNELLDEAGQYSKDQNVIVVLFVDEFHKMAEISPSLMESLKPRLEKSALHGFRLIAATTFQEYNDSIAKNRALDQRFLQIKLSELPKHAVIRILENRAKQHGVGNLLDKGILDAVYTESKRILISNAQPRASIDTLNSMIGDTVKVEYMKDGELVKEYFTPKEMGFATERVICRPLLKRVIKRMHGIDIDNEVNVTDVIQALKTRLYNQDNAIKIVVQQLEMAAQGFGELDRPKISFISTGTTGTGKSTTCNTRIPVYTKDGVTHKRAGDVQVGDYVFSREGTPTKILGVFPQGKRDVYRVTLEDGRTLDVSDNHLWAVVLAKRSRLEGYTIHSTQTLLSKGLETHHGNRLAMKYYIPMNQAVQWPERQYATDPYVIGAVISDGSLSANSAFVLSSDDEFVIEKVSRLLGAKRYKKSLGNCDWTFERNEEGSPASLVQQKEVVGDFPELFHVKSPFRRIPPVYMTGSIEQRWRLVHGLFDTDGSIGQYDGGRYNITYSTHSKDLAFDVQELLYSLGVASSVNLHEQAPDKNGYVKAEWSVHVKSRNQDKWRFFTLPQKLKLAEKAKSVHKEREKTFDYVGIRTIKKLGYQEEMVCFYVDNDEHLYQAGQYIVTHNTELAKIISETMRLPLKRFDMSRYSDPKDAGAFADDLFHAVWATPNAYLLIDEVEKSSKPAMNILLQVLDDARLTDSENSDRVASFSGAIINLTTNLGSEVYQNTARHQSESAETDTELVYKALADSDVFETAVLGRLDAIVPFHPLPSSALEKIARRTLSNLIEVAETGNRRIIVSEDVIPYIVKDRTSNDTERGGARDAKRNVKNIVAQELAHYLTYAKKEVPVLLYIKGKPRFKYQDIADPLNAQVALKECHPIETIDVLLQKLSAKLGKPLQNKGLYLPTDVPLGAYMQDIAKLSIQGFYRFKSEIDGEQVRIVGV